MTKNDYTKMRHDFEPHRPKVIFVAESPSGSNTYFYNSERDKNGDLFKAMMNDVLEYPYTSKEDGLKAFQAAGFLLIDATYTEVNNMEKEERENTIRSDFGKLVEDLECYGASEPGVGIVILMCRLHRLRFYEEPNNLKKWLNFEQRLAAANEKFTVLNSGTEVHFPNRPENKKRFRKNVRAILKLDEPIAT